MPHTGAPPLDRLLLLVGGHPTPNAVAARVLADPDTEVVLFHGDDSRGGTEAQARRLAKWITHKMKARCVFQPLRDPADTAEIREAVTAWLPEPPDALRLGLHYTGGTKEMSTTAVSVAERWAEAAHLVGDHRPSLTYLDARTLQLRFRAPTDATVLTPPPIPVGQNPIFALDDLLALHGWNYQQRPATHFLLARSATAVLAASGDDRGSNSWLTWSKKARRALSSGTSLPPPGSPHLRDVADALRDEIGVDGGGDLALDAVGVPRKALKQWFRSDWLEVAVAEALRDALRLRGGHVVQSLKLRADDDPVAECELDVVGLRGHQLFAVSCTVVGGGMTRRGRQGKAEDDKCRFRAYEVETRARQLGGDESALALVCTHPRPDTLERLLRRELRSHRVKIFGKPHLSSFSRHLEAFVKHQVAS